MTHEISTKGYEKSKAAVQNMKRIENDEDEDDKIQKRRHIMRGSSTSKTKTSTTQILVEAELSSCALTADTASIVEAYPDRHRSG
jgi:hypothetical protein